MPPTNQFCGAQFDVSDDDDDAVTVKSEDSLSTLVSYASCQLIFKPSVDNIRYADIQFRDIVELSCIEGTNILYIRALKNDSKMHDMMKSINSVKQPKIPALTDLKQKDVVVTKFSGDYSRATVIQDNGASVNVHLIDLGYTVQVPFDEIGYISPKDAYFPKMVIPVKLNIPDCDESGESAVYEHLKKWKSNRFTVTGRDEEKGDIEPNSIVDLLHITDGTSLTNECLQFVTKKWKIDCIENKTIGRRENVSICIIDNEHLSKGFICCILTEDIQQIRSQFEFHYRFL